MKICEFHGRRNDKTQHEELQLLGIYHYSPHHCRKEEERKKEERRCIY